MGLQDVIIVPTEKLDFLIDVKPQIFSESAERTYINIENFLTLVKDGYFKEPGQIHEVLEKSEIEFVLTPKEPRSPELEKRVLKLKAEQENKEYKKMVKDINTSTQSIGGSIRADVKQLTSQLTAVINFVLTVIGTFFFTYKAVEYALPQRNIPAQVMMGVITSTIVALADLFFIIRTI